MTNTPAPSPRPFVTEAVRNPRKGHREAAAITDCPLLGMFADGKVSVDKFIACKQAEKALEP